jgi:hypothetical protein
LLIATVFTAEHTLTDTVTLLDRATTGAGLRTIASVHKLHMDPSVGCFIGHKGLQLGKAPIAHGSSLLTASCGAVSDVSQVLHYQGITWLARGNQVLREDVVRISLKSFQSARYFLEVSLRRLCTFALKRTTQAEVAVIGLFDALATKEPRLGSDRKTIDTQINSDGLASGRADGDSARHHQVQPEFPLTVQQLSTLLLPLALKYCS